MGIKLVDKEALIFEIKFSQKRGGWIRVQFEEGKQCLGCILFETCYNSLGYSICSRILSETLIHRNVIFTPQQYRLCRVDGNKGYK